MIQAEDIKIKKITDKLLSYSGGNPYISYLRKKFISNSKSLTKTQIEYISKNFNREPIDLQNVVSITSFFANELQKEYGLKKPPEKVLVETIIGESDKAYHVLGKFYKNQEEVKLFWLPKTQLIDDLYSKYDDVKVDFEKYEDIDKLGRKYFGHQKVGAKFLLDKKKCILADDMGLGKGLVINTLIYTPYGTKKIGDLKIGDKVIGSDGKPYNVTGVFPQGIKETYKITLNDGYNIITDDEHLWSVSTSNYGFNTNNGRLKKSIVLSTKQMFDGGKIKINGNGNNKKKEYVVETHFKLPNGHNKWQIPVVKPIQFENNNELPINPYFLGLSLGDGHFDKRNNVKFSVHKDDYDELLGLFNLKPIKTRVNQKGGYIKLGSILDDLNLSDKRSHNKFIPDIYKYTTIQNRLSILQGLMDTDGHCMISSNGKFCGTEFSTISEKLCDDVAEIVHTLGGICRKKSRRSFYKKNGIRVECNISYRLNIKLPSGMNPFRLKRKSERYNEPKKYLVGRYIKNIEKISKDECVCISVDSPDKLYVSEHGIVTHNTTQAILAALESGAEKILIVCPSTLKINWQREIENFESEEDVSIIRSIGWNPAKFTIINYDILKNFHTIMERGKEYNPKKISRELVKEKFDVIILDESHYVKNPKSNRGKIIQEIIKESNPKYVWLLTGTPIANRPMDYFSLLGLINAPVASDWMYYARRYCGGRQIKTKINGKLRTIWLTDGASNLEELSERTKTTIIRRKKTDVLDLPEKIIVPVYIELENRDEYNDVFEKYLEWRKSQGKTGSVVKHLVELILLRKFIALEKVKHSIEITESAVENGKKVIIFTNFTEELNRFKDHFGKLGVYLDGSTKEKDRQKAVDRFQNDDKIKVFVGQIKAAGVGLTLTKAEIVIINSLDWVPGNLEQAEDRAYRIGQIKDVTIYYPLFDDTVDTLVWKVLKNKKSIINTIVGDIDDEKIIENIIEEL